MICDFLFMVTSANVFAVANEFCNRGATRNHRADD